MKAIGITIRDFLIYLIFLGLSIPFRILSYPGALKLGTFIVRLLFPLFPKYRRIALENIAYAFPDTESVNAAQPDTKPVITERHQQIFDEHLNHLGYLIADTFWKSRMNQEWFEKYVRYEPGAKEIEDNLIRRIESGKGFILVSGHIGTWENIVQFVGYRLHGAVLYKRIKNRFLDQWFEKQRGILGTKIYPMEETGSLIRYLRQGGVIGLAADQNAGGAGIFVDFLNRPASTYKGPATIALLAKTPLIFITLIHKGDGTVFLDFEDLGIIEAIAQLQDDKEAAIAKITHLWVNALERAIHKTPGQYFWVHRRWKTTPAMMKELKSKRS